MSFYKTQIGRHFFERQIPQLIKAVEGLASAISKPAQTAVLPVEPDSEFLSELYYGNYEPGLFKEVPETSELTHAVNDAYAFLAETLSEESKERLELYLDKQSERHCANIKRAYESGFRTAMQLVFAGLSRSSGNAA